MTRLIVAVSIVALSVGAVVWSDQEEPVARAEGYTPVVAEREMDLRMVHRARVRDIREDQRLADRAERRLAKKERRQEAAEARRQAAAEAAAEAEASSTSAIGSYPSGVLSAEQVASYARGAGFPESVIDTMVAIAYRESRFNPNATNASSGACGLWQLYPCPGPNAYDPAVNARLAYNKYAASGLAPWGM